MRDSVIRTFLEEQLPAGLALSASSDILELTPGPGSPPDRYTADYRCIGLVREAGEIRKADRFLVQIRFPRHYLEHVDPIEIFSVLAPLTIFHPNVAHQFLCPGHIPHGTSLVELLHQVYEILCYYRFAMSETDALNKTACAFARNNRHLFPLDPRPLRWRSSLASPAPVPAHPAGPVLR